MFSLEPLTISGREVLPIVEGGKGVYVSNGERSGEWEAAGGVGTLSGVKADYLDEKGQVVRQIYRGKTRRERNEELAKAGRLSDIDVGQALQDELSSKNALLGARERLSNQEDDFELFLGLPIHV